MMVSFISKLMFIKTLVERKPACQIWCFCILNMLSRKKQNAIIVMSQSNDYKTMSQSHSAKQIIIKTTIKVGNRPFHNCVLGNLYQAFFF